MSTTGVVKKWLPEKGCGYLAGPDGEDVFVHTSALGGGKLAEGAMVNFDIVKTRDGKSTASNVSGPGVVGGKSAARPGMPLPGMLPGMAGKGKGGKPMMSQAMKKATAVFMGRGTGVVRMFNKDKGFGFVVQDGGGPDLFFHRKDLPKLLPCPHCSEPFAIPCKSQGPPHHGAIDCAAPVLIKGGKVTFKIEMQLDGKMQAVDVQGDGVGAPRLEEAGDELMSLYECDSCKTQFQAIPGSVVKCPGCGIEIQV
eukprot:TRINITY_DN44026_c0_g1_i1.p2 TRINITY_DN44026_c0_g1~~TRINITY_DN44026_c0_g1_i1.p2  ORF type:complete len:253 (+),score=85.27 TRINITY_DN44026_c0_g1_i1:66-824(+)